MDSASVIQAAALIGAPGAALALLAGRRDLLLAGLALLGVGAAGLAYELVPSRDVGELASPARIGAIVLAVLALAGLAAAFLRFPKAIAVALLVAAPFRVPVEVGGTEASLLVPLYVVLAAACIAVVVRLARTASVDAAPLWLAAPAAAFIGLAALSTLWSTDVEQSAVDLLFFYFPYAALVALVVRTSLDPGLVRALGITAVGLAVGLGAIGLWQLYSGHLFFAEDVEVSNSYTRYDRTTSLFHDPSIYGRHLVLAILIVLVALWFERVRLWVGVGLIAFLGAALFFTYSQSSLVALAAGVLFVTLVVADRRSKLVVAGATLVLLVVGAVGVGLSARSESLKRVTSSRTELAANATVIAREHPLAGVGIGGEEKATRDYAASHPERLAKVSHTTPLTVAAELGAVGVVAYLAFLAGAARVLFLSVRSDRILGVTLATVFLAEFVHALFYSGFFEDPLLWFTLALAGAAALQPGAATAPAPVGGGPPPIREAALARGRTRA
jgi:putative inorganic carbon (HCO3(-)) transporter